MKNDQFNHLWQQAMAGNEITIEPVQLLSSLNRAKNLEQVRRAYEFADLFGGFVLIFILALFHNLNPGFWNELPLVGKFGLLLFLGTFLAYHINGFRVKRTVKEQSISLMQFLENEAKSLKKRIRFLNQFKWYLGSGLSGAFLLLNSLLEGFSWRSIVIVAVLSLFGGILNHLNQKSLQEEFLPLETEFTEKMRLLREEI